MEGRSGSTQEHASKEEVAPAGVTVIRIGNAEQGFHPGRKPHPGEKETSRNHRRRQRQLVDGEEYVNHRRWSTNARQEGSRRSRQNRAGRPQLRSEISGYHQPWRRQRGKAATHTP
jgi:hypothetical protein